MPHIAGFDAAQFKAEYWQRRHLWMPAAFPAELCDLDANDLAGLSLDDAVESRLILGSGNKWQCFQGPQQQQSLEQLPSRDWTLLVQSIELHYPPLRDVLNYFDFLPNWRLEDLMISCAATGGSVGPHYDQYDVFLIQLSGQRQWQTGDFCDASSPRLECDALRLLRDFQPRDSYIASPGDCLYLPPGQSHHGVALDDDCVTLSVGFRAPDQAELLQAFASEMLEQEQLSPRFRDANDLTGSAEIPASAIEQAYQVAGLSIAPIPLSFMIAFGRLVTRPMPAFWDIDATELEAPTSGLYPGARWAYIDAIHDNDACLLFVNGEYKQLPGDALSQCRRLDHALQQASHAFEGIPQELIEFFRDQSALP